MDVDKGEPMNKNILILLGILFITSIAYAQIPNYTFTDSFNSYANNYLILSDTNYPSGWSLANDANTPTTVKGNISNFAQFTPIDVSKQAGNTGGISRNLDQNFNLSDWNTSNSRMYMFLSIDNNANMIRAEIRLGRNSANYFEYRNNSPFGQGWFNGYQLVSFDLNNPNVVTGTPSLTDINFIQMNVSYNAGQVDFNVTFNRVWLERPPNAFNNNWTILDVGGQPDGWGMPFDYRNEGLGMALVDTNDPSLGNHSRIFIPQFNTIDSSIYNIDYQIDLNQVDTNWGTRMLFDAVNFSPGDNFSSCFLFDATNTSRRVGVEQWINGVRSFSQATLTMNYNDYNTMRCVVDGLTVRVYMNGTIVHSAQLLSREDGRIGLESFGGRTHFKNASLTLTPNFVYSVVANNQIIQTVENNIFPLVILVLFGMLIILLFLTTMKGGDPNSVIMFAVIGIGLLVVYLFFTSIINAVS